MSGYVGTNATGANPRYTFPDGSSFNYNDLVFGEHKCDGTIIPIIVTITRSGKAHYDRSGTAHYDRSGTAHYDRSGTAHYNRSGTVKNRMTANVNFDGKSDEGKPWSKTQNSNGLNASIEVRPYVEGAYGGTYAKASASFDRTDNVAWSVSGDAPWSVSGDAPWSVSGDAPWSVSGDVPWSHRESAIFLPLYYNSLNDCAKYVNSETAKAWLKK